MSTPAQNKAINKYKKTHLKRIVCEVRKEYYAETIKPYLGKNEISANSFVKKCIDYCIKHDIKFEDEN